MGSCTHTVVSLLAASAVLQGCIRPLETPFPDGVAPWEENIAPAPAETLFEKYPETLSMVSGTAPEGYLWLHARGFVHASVAEVFAALHDPDVMANRRGVAGYTARFDVELGFDLSFALDVVVRDVITLRYTNTIRGLVVDVDGDAPRVVGLRWQKTDGSALIAIQRGSIEVRATDEPERTEIALIQHLGAPRVRDSDLRCYQQDLYDDVVATVHAWGLPEYVTTCR